MFQEYLQYGSALQGAGAGLNRSSPTYEQDFAAATLQFAQVRRGPSSYSLVPRQQKGVRFCPLRQAWSRMGVVLGTAAPKSPNLLLEPAFFADASANNGQDASSSTGSQPTAK